ncbi:MAG: hydroxyacid dehydrogenase [Opitutaceae bacterium]
MTQNPVALAVLSEAEIADFLPGASLDRLKSLLPNLEFIDPTAGGFGDWPSLLSQKKPEILITAWKTPSLPESWLNDPGYSLKYLCHFTGTVRKLVPRPFLERGLVLTNWGNSISRTVAECGLLLTLSALRRASSWAIDMHLKGAWKTPALVTESLFGRRVGLHGFGNISQHLARLMQPFEVPIATYSPSVPDSVLESFGVTRADSLEALFSENNVIVELAAYKPENRHLVSERILRLIPEGGTFVNVGRGAVVDEAALLKIAREGRLQVALDVYETEPLPADSGFRGLPNVTLTPHIGGPTIDRRQDAGALGVENIANYLQGKPLEAVVSLSVYDRST